MIALLTAQLAEQGKGREAAEAQLNFRNDLLTGGLDSAQQIFDSKGPLREQGMGALADFLNSSGRGIFDTGGRSPGDLTGFVAGPGGSIIPGAAFPGAPTPGPTPGPTPPGPLPPIPPPLPPIPQGITPTPLSEAQTGLGSFGGKSPQELLALAQAKQSIPLGPQGQIGTTLSKIKSDPAFASGLAMASRLPSISRQSIQSASAPSPQPKRTVQ